MFIRRSAIFESCGYRTTIDTREWLRPDKLGDQHMFQYVLAMLAQASAPTPAEDCAAFARQEGYHLADVCSDWIDGKIAYAATYQASLVARPGAQQVLIYESSDGWMMRIAGYRRDAKTGTVLTKRRDIPLDYGSREAIQLIVNMQTIEDMGKLPYYGSNDVICTDGAKYEVAMATEGRRFSASQHSCADPSRLHEVMGLFRAIALANDPDFNGFLTGLKFQK